MNRVIAKVDEEEDVAQRIIAKTASKPARTHAFLPAGNPWPWFPFDTTFRDTLFSTQFVVTVESDGAAATEMLAALIAVISVSN
jgi:hypothetical protein